MVATRGVVALGVAGFSLSSLLNTTEYDALKQRVYVSVAMWQQAGKDVRLMGALGAPYMAKTDKERLATGFWNRIESNQATDCNSLINRW